MRKPKIFMDTEFTSLNSHAKLISIGMVSEDGCTFYAELNNYSLSDCSIFVQNHVVPNLRFSPLKPGVVVNNIIPFKDYDITQRFSMEMVGNPYLVAECIEQWLTQFVDDTVPQVEIWSDVYAYDWVLFCDLFGGAPLIPKSIYYIPQDLASWFAAHNMDPDLSRAEYAQGLYDISTQHNALSDAYMIRACCFRLLSSIV